jgi:hypothetical protein
MPTHITISAPRPAPSFTPLFVAIDRFLPEEGLEADVIYDSNINRLTSGEVDYAATAVGRGGLLEPRGAILVCQHATRATGHTLMVRPHIESPEMISNVVMVGDDVGSSDQGLDRELTSILKQHGVELENADIQLTRVEGGHPLQYRALMEGIGDGAPVGAPWWIFLAREGYHNLGCEADYSPGMGCNGVHVTPERIASRPEEVAGFVRAYVKAVRFCHENMDESLEIMQKWAKEWGVESLDTAKEVYKAVSPYWNPEIDPAVIQRLLDRTAEKTGKPVEPMDSVLEMRFLNEALGKA